MVQETNKKTLEILLAEDHSIVRMGTNMLINELYASVRVTEVTTFTTALRLLRDQPFDLLILDINIPGGDNLQMIGQIRQLREDLPILIFSSYEEGIYAIRYLREGANGYIQKESSPEEIKIAIQKVLNRETYASTAVQQQLFDYLGRSKKEFNPGGLNKLSNRELEIMQLLVKGHSSSQIKDSLGIQLSTISTFKARIFEKMEVNNVVELIEKLKLMDQGRGNNPADGRYP